MEWFLSIFAKEAIKAFYKAYIEPIYAKNGKIHLRRVLLVLGVIGIGFAVYEAPDYMQRFALVFIYSSIDEIPANSFIAALSDEKYREAIKYNWSLVYLLILLVNRLVIIIKKHNETLGKDEDRKVAHFAREVGLIEGWRCANDEERVSVINAVADKIEHSNESRFMLINGYHDLIGNDSPIRQAIDVKGRSCFLKVLLLDPFSSYAKKRADRLLPEVDEDNSHLRYIRDYYKVRSELDRLAASGIPIQYKVYCSKPFFRVYLFDNEAIFQTYLDNRHGHQTPMYHYTNSDRSMFHLAEELFSYHWNKGFKFNDADLQRRGEAFTVYLAREMYKLDVDSLDIDGMRKAILDHVEALTKAAEEAEQRGYLTDWD